MNCLSLISFDDLLRYKFGEPVKKVVITGIRLIDNINACYHVFDVMVNLYTVYPNKTHNNLVTKVLRVITTLHVTEMRLRENNFAKLPIRAE